MTEKFEEIHSSFTLQSKKVKKLQQKANDQHKINKMLEEKIKKCDDNNAKVFKLQEYWNEKNSELKEEFTEEFQAASSFMSHLQTQYESLSHEFKENKAMDMIEVLQVRFISKNVVTINCSLFNTVIEISFLSDTCHSSFVIDQT